MMIIKYLFPLLVLTTFVASQEDYDDRGLLHKKKRRPQASPCRGFGRDLSTAATEDERSLPIAAALGGAAAGYYLSNKKKHGYSQQPVINNYVYAGAGGGYPCGGGGGGFPGGHGGSGGHLTQLGSLLSGNRGGYGGGYYNSGINWDRTIRQFNRNIVRPLANAWF